MWGLNKSGFVSSFAPHMGDIVGAVAFLSAPGFPEHSVLITAVSAHSFQHHGHQLSALCPCRVKRTFDVRYATDGSLLERMEHVRCDFKPSF